MSLRRHVGSYTAIGLLQWLVEYGLMLVLSEWVMPVKPANVLGRLAGATLGFWLNGKWTFAGDDTHMGGRAALRFVLMWLMLTLLNTWLVGIIDDDFGLRRAQMLKPLVDVLTGAIGFLLSRHWVYKRRGGGVN